MNTLATVNSPRSINTTPEMIANCVVQYMITSKVVILSYACSCQIHTDAMNNRHRKTSLTIFTSHFICKGSKRLCGVLLWEGAGDRTETVIFWPPLLWPSTLCLSRSPDAQPVALGSTLLGAGFLYCILSATSLVPKLHRGSRGPPRPGVAFPTTSRL